MKIERLCRLLLLCELKQPTGQIVGNVLVVDIQHRSGSLTHDLEVHGIVLWDPFCAEQAAVDNLCRADAVDTEKANVT